MLMSENVPDTGNLTTEQRKAIDALASGASKEQAALIAGRTERTLNRWIAEDPAFAAALQEMGDTAVKDAARRLKVLLQKAITAVEGVLDNPEAKAGDVLRAFDMIASHVTNLTQFSELQDRIAELEQWRNGES